MRLAPAALIALVASSPAFAADIKGAADHPLIPRYEGSEIVKFASEEFTDYRLMTAPAKAYGGKEKNPGATVPLEGRLTRITYRAPAERSSLEVMRNYEEALRAAGFETVFACAKEECGGRNFNHAVVTYDTVFGDYYQEQRFVAARLPRAEGDVYASVYAVLNRAGGGPNKDRAMVQLDVIELKPMERKMVVVEAPQMQQDLAAAGRVAIYGILFDFDKDTMRAESKPQLEEIARLLMGAPGLKVLIVGHTDNQGSPDYNLDLSRRRAASVVKALTGEYGIATDRLAPVGVGMAAPVATNRSEEGRAKNRRVELVER